MWPNPQFSADLVTFTEEILNEKFHFLCSSICDLDLYRAQKTRTGSLKKACWMMSQKFCKFSEKGLLGIYLTTAGVVEYDSIQKVFMDVSMSSYIENLQLTSSVTW